MTGELHIGGAGLARGYLNQPELTATRFIPNPFSQTQGARLYRTGDAARLLPDGRIEFLGRLDHQVKVRGYRIELEEIESVLRADPQVQECVVLVREDVPGDKRIVAYLVPTEPAPSVTDLRAILKQQLPDYMIPSAFVMLAALPLTPNGKIDRNALQAPDAARAFSEDTFVAPRTSVERQLVEIWEDVLRVEHVGVNDNFFELGGHSLLMIEVRSKLLEVFGLDITVADLFRFPTISALAKFLNEELAQQQPASGEPSAATASDTAEPEPPSSRTRPAGASQQRQARRARRAAEQQEENVDE